MKKSMVFTMFLFLSICLYSDEISKESKDLIFSIKGNYFSSNYKNSSQEENYFKSDDSNISCEPSINMISKNPRSTSHLYLNSKGKYIKSKAKCTVYAFNYESKQKENMLIYDGDVEMIRTGLNLGYKRLIHNQKSIINFLNIDGKFDHYKSEYSANSFLNSKLRMTFITIDFGYVFKPIENSDMYFASTRKSDITEYYLYNKQANFESEFYFTPHIENNIFNNSFYKNYDYGEPYKTEEKYTHQSFGLNLETRTIYRKKNLITGLRFSVIYGILFNDFWNYDDIPSELRGNIEIFANLLLDKFILTSNFFSFYLICIVYV